jgi:hypothetical protein
MQGSQIPLHLLFLLNFYYIDKVIYFFFLRFG